MFPIEPFMVQPCLLVASLACPILPQALCPPATLASFQVLQSAMVPPQRLLRGSFTTWTILLSTCSSVYSSSFSLSSEGTSSGRKTRSSSLVNMLP